MCVWDAVGGRELGCAGNSWKRFEFWYIPQFTTDRRHLAIPYGPAVRGEVCLWDFAGSGKVLRFEGRHPDCVNLALSPDGRTLASVNSGGTVKLWDVASRTESGEIEGRGLPLSAVTFSPDGGRVLTGGTDETKVWDLVTRLEIARLLGGKGDLGGWMLQFHDRDTLLAVNSEGIHCLRAPSFLEIEAAEKTRKIEDGRWKIGSGAE
jgi:WD40 repeat protein